MTERYKSARTKHISRSSRIAEEIPLLGQGVAEAQEQVGAALEAGDLVPGARLEALGELFDGQFPQAVFVDLVFVVGVSREYALFEDRQYERYSTAVGRGPLRLLPFAPSYTAPPTSSIQLPALVSGGSKNEIR